MSSTNNKIHLTGPYRKLELPAAGTILPGMLIEQAATGVQAHSTSGGFAERLFANEDALQGGTAQGVWNGSAYVGYTVAGINAQGPDPVNISAEAPGNLVLALLKSGYDYTEGLKLISNGDGTLIPTTGTPKQIIAVITDQGVINLSASSAVNTLSQVRVA